jgi:hypothetical protein
VQIVCNLADFSPSLYSLDVVEFGAENGGDIESHEEPGTVEKVTGGEFKSDPGIVGSEGGNASLVDGSMANESALASSSWVNDILDAHKFLDFVSLMSERSMTTADTGQVDSSFLREWTSAGLDAIDIEAPEESSFNQVFFKRPLNSAVEDAIQTSTVYKLLVSETSPSGQDRIRRLQPQAQSTPISDFSIVILANRIQFSAGNPVDGQQLTPALDESLPLKKRSKMLHFTPDAPDMASGTATVDGCTEKVALVSKAISRRKLF